MPVEPEDDNSDNSMIIPNEEDSGSGVANQHASNHRNTNPSTSSIVFTPAGVVKKNRRTDEMLDRMIFDQIQPPSGIETKDVFMQNSVDSPVRFEPLERLKHQ